MSIKEMLKNETVKTVTVIIDDFKCELSVENALKLATIAQAMADGKDVTPKPVKNTKSNNTKKSNFSRNKSKDFTWGDRRIVYKVEKFGKGYKVDHEVYKKDERLYGLPYVSKMMNNIYSGSGATLCEEEWNGHKVRRPFFKTKKQADEFVATLPTVLRGADCKKVNDEIFANRKK